jgi:hypothetical protein
MPPPPPRSQFYQVVSEAINDLIEHGFDSQERLDEWLRRLEMAAHALLVPRSVLENALRDGLQRVFARTTTTANLLKVHQGISQYTLEMIKPKLRAELDRRILASASLIKLNREASVQRTLQRFAGWATSIPIGGTDVAQRQEVKETVRRGIAALPFEERRVVIDQGHKLSAAINEIVSRDGGAIAGRWRHVMEGGGYQARPEHVARNNHIYVLRDNWAMQQGLMKLAGRQYYDEITAAGQEVYCRCTVVWMHALRDLPPEMLTTKGRDELARVREQIARMKA